MLFIFVPHLNVSWLIWLKGRISALTQPEVQVILQVPGALLDGVEDQIGIAAVEPPVQVLRHGHQVEVLHPPHLETLFLPGPFELWVLYCHVVCRKTARWDSEMFTVENGASLEAEMEP